MMEKKKIRKRLLLGVLGILIGSTYQVEAADWIVDESSGGTNGKQYETSLSVQNTSREAGSGIAPVAWNRGTIGATSRIVYGDNITVTTTGTSTTVGPSGFVGIYSNWGYDIKAGNYLTLNTAGKDADGIRTDPAYYASGASGTITVGNNLTIVTQGISADGVNLNGESTAIIGDYANITTTGNGTTGNDGSYGLRVNANSQIVVGDHLTITTTGSPGLLGRGSSGIYVADISGSSVPYGTGYNAYTRGASIIVGDDSKVTTSGSSAHGIYVAEKTGLVQIGERAQIETKGSSAYGIDAVGRVEIGSGANILTGGSSAHGLYAEYKTTVIPAAYTGDSGVITLTGGTANTITTKGSGAHGIVAYNGGKVNGEDVTIGAQGANAYGVRLYETSAAARSSEIHLTNGTITSAQSDAVRLDGTGSPASNPMIFSLDQGSISSTTTVGINQIGGQGKVTLTDAQVDSTKEAIRMEGKNAGDQMDLSLLNGTSVNNNILVLGTSDVKLGTLEISSDQSSILGDMKADANGILNANLVAGSYWKGIGDYTISAASNTASGALNVSLDQSDWDMTGTSNLTNLTANNSTITFDLSGDYKTLNVGDLAGTGIFVMRTNIEAGEAGGMIGSGIAGIDGGDLLNVTGTTAGSHQLDIRNQGGAAVDEKYEHLVVQTADGGGNFALTHNVEVGAYEYGIHRDSADSNNWSLFRLKEKDGAGRSTTTAKAALNETRAGYYLNYGETQTLIQRMGDLRNNPESDGNVWAKIVFGKNKVNGTSELDGFDQSYGGIQVGADKKAQWDNGNFYKGVFAGYTNGSQDYQIGTGDIDNRYLGIYGTYIGNNGFYVDGVAKFNWMDQSFRVRDTEGNLVKADSSTSGAQISLEVGQRVHFDKEKKEGFYLEPQAQIIWGSQSGDNYTATNGLRIDKDSYHYLIGRLGLMAGYEIKGGKNPVNVYAIASYNKEFEGTYGSRMNGEYLSGSLEDSWWTYGVGITTQFSKKHNLYFDVERASGGDFTQSWKLDAGYRFQW